MGNCNAIFRNYCVAIGVCDQNLSIAKLPENLEFLIFLQFFRSCCTASARHGAYRNFDVRPQHNNFLNLH